MSNLVIDAGNSSVTTAQPELRGGSIRTMPGTPGKNWHQGLRADLLLCRGMKVPRCVDPADSAAAHPRRKHRHVDRFVHVHLRQQAVFSAVAAHQLALTIPEAGTRGSIAASLKVVAVALVMRLELHHPPQLALIQFVLQVAPGGDGDVLQNAVNESVGTVAFDIAIYAHVVCIACPHVRSMQAASPVHVFGLANVPHARCAIPHPVHTWAFGQEGNAIDEGRVKY